MLLYFFVVLTSYTKEMIKRTLLLALCAVKKHLEEGSGLEALLHLGCSGFYVSKPVPSVVSR